ncbi:MAG: NAD(+)/NADH kinase [Clostridia bacterium]|nr:NAD(+)/NADH kinase [Clostridia bacterium]
MIKRALFYLNKGKAAVADIVRDAAKLCREREIEPSFFSEDAGWLQEQLPDLARDAVFMQQPVPGKTDLILVFGGDGTMLRALDSYVSSNIPMLGVNLGRMGFLLETQPDELAVALDLIKAGKYEIERRMMLHVKGVCSGKEISAHATNEVSVSRGLSQRMIAMDAYVGDMLVDHYIADGLVLSSPTGSTAYSLSAGGPIIAPDVQCFLLNPICPHTLTARPIVLSAKEHVRLKIHMKEMREGIQLSVDGQAVCEMRNLEEISVMRSPHDALLIRFGKERNYFSLLKDKLSQWSL